MPSCAVIKFKDINIVYTDIAGASPEEAASVFVQSQAVISKLPLKSVYALVNAKDARFNKNLIQTIKETVKNNNPHNLATAVSGLNQLSRLMVNSIISFTGRNMKLTETVDDAKEWLYEQSMRKMSA